jgi:hypothetical protein
VSSGVRPWPPAACDGKDVALELDVGQLPVGAKVLRGAARPAAVGDVAGEDHGMDRLGLVAPRGPQAHQWVFST